MNATMIAHQQTIDNAHTGMPVNTRRFVSALSEYDQGKALYYRGKSLSECVTDEMAQGYLDAEYKGADNYFKCMMAQARA